MRKPVRTGPAWFQDAIETQAENRALNSHGTRISYRRYDTQVGRPTLLFVHGHAAHARWWDFIAPFFIDRFNVVAMDLAGAGDSGHRDTYSAETYSDDIIAVVREENAGAGAFIVGHSFGGSMTRVTGYRYGDEIRGIVLADSVISDKKSMRPTPARSSGRTRHYPSLEQGKRRFRLRPPQPCANDFIIDYIAGHSLRETPDGFQFKLDQDVFAKMIEPPGFELPDGVTTLQQMPCPAALIYGEQSRFFPPEALDIARRAISDEYLRCIPGAHHHVFLDQPLAFVEALKAVLNQFLQTR